MKISDSLTKKFNQFFEPAYLKVINESPQHNVPDDSETHFKVTIASSFFKGLSLVKRHQAVYDLVKEELENGLHALSLVTLTPEEWEKRQGKSESPSPACRGGLAHSEKSRA